VSRSDIVPTRNSNKTTPKVSRVGNDTSPFAVAHPSETDVSLSVRALSLCDRQGLTQQRGARGHGFCIETVTFVPQVWSEAG